MQKKLIIVSTCAIITAIAALTAFGVSTRAETSGSSTPDGTKARAILHDAAGNNIGVVKLA